MAFNPSRTLSYFLAERFNPDPTRFRIIQNPYFGVSIIDVNTNQCFGTWNVNEPFYDAFKNGDPTIQRFFVQQKFKQNLALLEPDVIAAKKKDHNEILKEEVIHFLEKN